MKTISKLLFLTIVVLLVSLGAVSATDNISDTSQSSDIIQDNIATNTQTSSNIVTGTYTKNSDTTINQNKTIEKTNNEKNVKEAGRTTKVTESSYSQFFIDKSKYYDINDKEITEDYVKANNLVENKDYSKVTYKGCSAYISDGDTIDLSGTFTNKIFGIDKKITLTSINKDATLKNSMVYVRFNGTGSTISNLVIRNDHNASDQTSGIVLDKVNNILVENNNVITSSYLAHPFDASTNNSIIRNNYFESQATKQPGRTHTAMVFCGSNYNVIANNSAVSDNANCIYLSEYPGQSGIGVGGPSNYNNITGNNATGVKSAWSYTIQMMGSHNIASYNNVSGGYRGISSAGESNTIDHNNVTGWQYAVVANIKDTVSNNYVYVYDQSVAVNVEKDDNNIINNTISSENGFAINIGGNNINIQGNTITSTENYGIYSKPSNGGLSQIRIVNNKINTKKDGIFFTNSGLTKYVNDILADNNNIITESDYAINFKDAGGRTASDINVTVTSSNVLKSNKGTGNVAYLPPTKATGTVDLDTDQKINITSLDIYNKYFDDNGVANSNVTQNATVYISTTLNNKNLTFTKKVHVIGQNGILNNGTISLTENAHASTITGVTIKNTKTDTTVHAIELIEVNNCQLTGNTIENYGKYESLGIFVDASSGNTITSNNIKTSGDYVNNGILVYESTANTIEKNTINLNQSNVDYAYQDEVQFNDKIGIIQEVLHNHGIILLYSSSNTINNNKVTTTSMYKTYAQPTEDRKNSVVGIDIYFQSDNNKVTNNVINVDSYGPYAYGFGVLGGQWGSDITRTNATNNIFQNNNVTVKGGYFATGFIAGKNSVNTILDSNNINVEARRNINTKGDYAYGITLENSTKTNITNNNVTLNGAAAYSIELFSTGNNNIKLNTIKATGTNPYGIAGGDSSNNQILNNTITITKSNSGSSNAVYHSDQIPLGEEGIMFMYKSTNNNIQYNTIKTNTNSTVKLTNDSPNNNVTENSLTSNTKIGDQSVTSQHPSNIVKNNFVYFVNVTVDSFSAMTGDTVTLVAHVNTTTTDYRNLSVSFKIGATVVGNASVVNGKSTLSYSIPSYFNPTTYTVVANVGGINFQNASGSAYANIGKIAQQVRVDVARVSSVIGGKVNLEANITTLTGGKIGAGQAVFYLDGKRLEAIDVKLGNAVSKNQPVGNNPGIYNITVLYTGGGYDYLDGQGSNLLTVQSPTTITVYDYVAGLGDEVVFKLPIVSGGRNVTTGNARILIAGKVIGNVTASNGLIYYKYVIPTSYNKGVLDYSVVYDGNSTIGGASGTGKLTVNPFSSEILFNSTSATVGSQVSLTVAINNGRSGSRFFAADGGNVAVKLNGKTLTDSNGKAITGNVVNGSIVFKFTATEQLVGTHNLTFDYAGNNKFAQKSKTFTNGLTINKKTTTPTNNTNTTKPSTNTTTPTVARATIITIDAVKDVNYLGKTKITGIFKDEIGTILYNSNILASVNGKSFTVKTDSKGVYSFDAEATRAGKNFVSVYFRGNSYFKPSSNSVTFLSLNTPTIITINGVKNVAYQGKTRVTGTFKDAAGNLLFNSNVLASVNGKSFTVKTDSKGVFSFDADASLVGKNFISVYFRGNSLYKPSSNTVNFIAYDAPTVITINPISTVSYGSNVKITGTFKDVAGNILFNSNVMISVNGKSYTVKTDSKGVFTLTAKASLAGKNFVSVYFRGNTIYRATSTSLTFIANNVGTNITINKINTVKQGSNVVISGSFKDVAGNRMFNSTVTLKLNNKSYKVKTDSYGNFKYTTKDTILGTNTVQISSTANTIYKATTTTTKFSVIK